MRKKELFYVGIFLGFTVIMFFIIFGFLVNSNFKPLEIDVIVRDFAYDIRGEKFGFMYWCNRILTELGFLYVMVLIFIILAVVSKLGLPSFIFGCGAIFTYFFNLLIKLMCNRERPYINLRWMHEISSSVPSGHASTAMFAYVILMYLAYRFVKNNKIKITAYILCPLIILIVGFTRIVIGVHYFTDILSGYMIGGFCACIWILICNLCVKKNFNFLNPILFKKKNIEK